MTVLKIKYIEILHDKSCECAKLAALKKAVEKRIDPNILEDKYCYYQYSTFRIRMDLIATINVSGYILEISSLHKDAKVVFGKAIFRISDISFEDYDKVPFDFYSCISEVKNNIKFYDELATKEYEGYRATMVSKLLDIVGELWDEMSESKNGNGQPNNNHYT